MQIVQGVYHQEPDVWWADSPDVSGYGAAAATLDELRELVREGVPFFLEVGQVKLDERFPTTVVSAQFEASAGWYTRGRTAASVRARSTMTVPNPPVRLHAA
jgi:hypothetical protein